MIIYPPKSEHFSPKIDHHQQLVNIYPKSNHSLPKMVIYALFTSKCCESHLRAFVVKSTRVPGKGGSSQSWQCQDFESSQNGNPSLIVTHLHSICERWDFLLALRDPGLGREHTQNIVNLFRCANLTFPHKLSIVVVER